MNYVVPYIGGNVDYIIIPVAGTYTGVYLLQPVPSDISTTITSDTLFSGATKLNTLEVVELNGVKYEIILRRVQKSSNWTFENGALVFYGIQHDHMLAMDYQHETGYKDHQFENVEGWFANLQFNPCFGILVNNDNPADRTLVFFETANQIRNPYLNYNDAVNVSSIDDIIHDLLFCVEQNSVTVTQGEYTTVTVQLNRWFENQSIVVQPLVNVPVANEVFIDTEGKANIIYRTSDLYGSTIKFRVFASPISAGTITVNLDTNTSSLSL